MKKTVFAALFLAMVLLCGTALAKDEIVLSGGDNAMAGKIDPVRGYGVWGPDIFHCHLLKPGKDNLLEKDLATDEKVSEDGLRYTYEIREDAKFTDGHPLTAEDIVFTFESTKAAASVADLSMLESVRALDDRTVEFTLSRPWSFFPHLLSYVGIVPKHAYKEGYGDMPLGSGAWRIVDFQIGQQMILEPNPHYYGKKSPFKRVTILKVDDDATLAAAKSGQLDFVFIPAEFAATKQEVPGMKLLTLDTFTSLAINLPVIPEGVASGDEKVGNNVTCDPAIRRALNVGISRQLLVDQALSGMGKPSFTIGGGWLPWASKRTFEDGRLEEAKKILEDAGWVDSDGDGIREKDGLKAEFTIKGRSNDMPRYNVVVAVAESAKALGIHIIPQSAPWVEARHARATPTCWAFGYPSPSDFYLFYHSSQINKGVIGNPPSYSNPEVDALIDRALRATSQEESDRLWQQAEELADADVPFLYVACPQDNYLVRDGLTIPPLGRVKSRNQGGAGLENLNEWSWSE